MSNANIQLRTALRTLLQQATTGGPDAALEGGKPLPPTNAAVLRAKLALEETKPRLMLERKDAESLHTSLEFLQARFGLPVYISFMAMWDGDHELYKAEFQREGLKVYRRMGLDKDCELWSSLTEMHTEYEL